MAEAFEQKSDPVTHVKCLGGTCKSKRCKSCVDFPNADINPGLLKLLSCLAPSSCIIVVMKGASSTQQLNPFATFDGGTGGTSQPVPMYYIGSFGGTECGILTLNNAVNPAIVKMMYYDFTFGAVTSSASSCAQYFSNTTTFGTFAGPIALNLSDVSAIWQTPGSLCSCYLATSPPLGEVGFLGGGSTPVSSGAATTASGTSRQTLPTAQVPKAKA